MQRPRALRAPLLIVCVLLGGVSGCDRSVECFDIGADECQRVADAASRSVPPGHTRLVVDTDLGPPMSPYRVFACYPDGSQIVVEVTLTGGGAHVEPLEGVELASCGR